MIEYVNEIIVGSKSLDTRKRRYSTTSFDEMLDSFVIGLQEQLLLGDWAYLTANADALFAAEHEQTLFFYKLLLQAEKLYFRQENAERFKKQLKLLLNELTTLHYRSIK